MVDSARVSVEIQGPEIVECYPGPLNLAILNLVANSIDAIEGKGSIEISAHTGADRFELSVTDDGPGVPDAIKDRIFEPFFTTKPVGQGTGLGLSISYSIAERHGGELVLSSAKGRTTMTLRFPLAVK